nr:isochorismate synthase MenF [Pantoea sp. 201603H]
MTFSAAIAQLQQELQNIRYNEAGCRQICIALSDEEDALAWLGAQHCWPQLYMMHRNERAAVAACGEVMHFDDIHQAQAFSRWLPANVQIWGANDFAGELGFLFLPRLMWQRRGKECSLILTLCSETSLSDDILRAQIFLTALRPWQPLPPLSLSLCHRQHHPDKPEWIQLVEQATDAILKGSMEKVVLARATDLQFTSAVSPVSLLAASRAVNQGCYHFLLAFDQHQAFIGSTPERLFLRQQTELFTEALAGTVANPPDNELAEQYAFWLRHDDKNQHENMLVVEDICQRLQSIVSGLALMAPEIIRLRNVQHLRRRIHGQLRQINDALCLSRLQPTAAVAGVPRNRARDFISRYESFPREWYAGTLGYLSRQRSEFSVSLRSAFVHDRCVRLYAGAGIVAGSDAEREWQEIENKAAALASLLYDAAVVDILKKEVQA